MKWTRDEIEKAKDFHKYFPKSSALREYNRLAVKLGRVERDAEDFAAITSEVSDALCPQDVYNSDDCWRYTLHDCNGRLCVSDDYPTEVAARNGLARWNSENK